MMRRDAMGLSAGKAKKSFQIRVAGGGCMEHGYCGTSVAHFWKDVSFCRS